MRLVSDGERRRETREKRGRKAWRESRGMKKVDGMKKKKPSIVGKGRGEKNNNDARARPTCFRRCWGFCLDNLACVLSAWKEREREQGDEQGEESEERG